MRRNIKTLRKQLNELIGNDWDRDVETDISEFIQMFDMYIYIYIFPILGHHRVEN